MFESELNQVSGQIHQLLQARGLSEPPAVEWSPLPFVGHWGAASSICLKAAAALARREKGSSPVPVLAQQLAEQIAPMLGLPSVFERAEATRGYLNLHFDTQRFAQAVVETVLRELSDFGRGAPRRERVMVEYAQPNTHHSFHIGHLRNAVLGEALARLVEFAGFETIRASYPGDIGLGVIRCLWGYQKLHAGQEPDGVMERGRWLAQIYTEATALLEEKPGETDAEREHRLHNEAEVKEMYRLWDTGDPQVRELWRRTRQWSLDELAAILKMLDIHIEVFFYESEVDEPSKAIVDELIALGIAEDERPSGGPVIVHVDEKLGLKSETYRTAVILRSDGTSLYLTKDLALAKTKFEQYAVDRSIYVVDVRQSLHFQQAFKILELWGFPQAAKCHHLAYEIVTLPEGTMSARKGRVVYFQDVADEAIRRVEAIIAEKNPNLAGAQRGAVALAVGLGALRYAMLAVDNVKQITFDWESALSFDGQAAPYIQYAHVRAASILARANGAAAPTWVEHQLHPAEVNLIDAVARFPTEVQRAAQDYKPLYMANYAFALAKAFTEFYQQCPVLQAEPGTQAARLALVAAAKQVLSTSLRLLGLQAPESM
jgi:arginyl-tRNA synthetase